MKKLSVLFLVLIFSFCTKNEESDLPRIYFPKVKDVYKVDTDTMLKIQLTPFLLCFPMNFDRDTTCFRKIDPLAKEHDFFKNGDTRFPRYNFKITVDTSYTIDQNGFEYKTIPLPKKEFIIIDGQINGKNPTNAQIRKSVEIIGSYCNNIFKQHDDYIKCYPLLVFNNENKNVPVGEVSYIQEAKDRDGKWKPIEFFEKHRSCIPRQYFLRFEEKKYMSFPIIKYYGSFKTKLRVKMQINRHFYYSNEFEGTINQGQFSKKYLFDYLKKYHSESLQKKLDYNEEAQPYLLKEI